jgi:histidinol phosphatase-like enzyme (inositol monophosphatase family)
VPPPPIDVARLDEAVELARAAGRETLRWFRSADLAVDTKDDGSPVTAADRAAERLLRREISARYPADSIIGEEEPDRRGTGPATWVLDPVDGTKAFTHGVPLFSNLVAYFDEHGPAIGVINLPALGETVYAGRGLGCFVNGTPCRVSTTAALADAYVCTSGLDNWPPTTLARFASVVKLRTWGDGYGYALVATGRADAMIDPEIAFYDVAAMLTILPEAGGRFTDLAGVHSASNGTAMGSNHLLHDELLATYGR